LVFGTCGFTEGHDVPRKLEFVVVIGKGEALVRVGEKRKRSKNIFG
jgi:hypothetical protein